jgi:Flp pilus assembly pilin Flp
MQRVTLESGQGLLEYALIFTFIVVIVIVLVYVLGPGIGNMYSQVIVGL